MRIENLEITVVVMIWPWYKLKIKIISLLIDLKTDVRCNKICLRYVLKFTILDYIVLSTYGMECPLLLSLVRMSVAVPELYHVAPLAAALLLLAAQLIHCSTSCRPKRSKIIFGKNPRTEWEHLCKLRKLALSLFYKPITGEGFFFFFNSWVFSVDVNYLACIKECRKRMPEAIPAHVSG